MLKSDFSFPVNQSGLRLVERHIDIDQFSEHWTIWHSGAILGLVGGFLAGVGGLILCAATYFAAASVSEANVVTDANLIGTCLTISTIPLLMVGAHCLDKIDESVKKKELAYKEKKRARFANVDLY